LDNHDKASALSTVQIDVENCRVFGIGYTDEAGERATPLVLHTSVSGSIDRNLYALLEHQAARMKKGQKGLYPFWLAPTQLRFVPVSDPYVPLCEELARDWPYRADVDDRDMSLKKKIRVAEQEWVPFIAVVGEQEQKGGDLHVRVRGGEDFVGPRDELIRRMDELAAGKPRRPLNTPLNLSRRPIFVG